MGNLFALTPETESTNSLLRMKGGTGQESYRQLGRTTNIITGVELGLPKTPRGFETEGYIVVKCLSCANIAQWLERL